MEMDSINPSENNALSVPVGGAEGGGSKEAMSIFAIMCKEGVIIALCTLHLVLLYWIYCTHIRQMSPHFMICKS